MTFTVRQIVYGVVGFIAATVLFMMTYQVEEYERVVVTGWGKFSSVSGPGRHFRVPFYHGLQTFRTDKQSFTNKGHAANTYTVDNQEVNVVFTVQYLIPPTSVERIYREAQNYESLIQQTAVDRLKSEMGKVNATNVAENRGAITKKLFESLAPEAERLGLLLLDFQLTNIDFTDAYRKSVEAAAREKAAIDQKRYERLQAEENALKAKTVAEGTANAAREAAKGEADAILVKATANAKAIRLEGEAKAEAMKKQADALAANARLVELTKAERWNGALPTWTGGGPVPWMQITAPKEGAQ